MSTRATIQVKGKEGIYPIAVYKHCDGYADGQGWLIDFAKEFKKVRGDDPEYAIAQIIRWFHTRPAELKQAEEWTKKGMDDYLFLGWGVFPCNKVPERVHGDIQYSYMVNLETGTVEIRNVRDKGKYEPLVIGKDK